MPDCPIQLSYARRVCLPSHKRYTAWSSVRPCDVDALKADCGRAARRAEAAQAAPAAAPASAAAAPEKVEDPRRADRVLVRHLLQRRDERQRVRLLRALRGRDGGTQGSSDVSFFFSLFFRV